MKDNLSIVVTMIIFVVLIVIFPLYNYFERQDDMSYNLALKATIDFVDEVLENGYLTQEMYEAYTNELSNTGNIYDIQLEAHKKVLTSEGGTTDNYNEQYKIDYNKDILESSGEIIDMADANIVKNNAYYLKEGDQFYVKMKNSNTTMAGAIFNTIVPTASKDRINVNYGGYVKNQAWAKVDSTYYDTLQVVNDAPKIKLTYPTTLSFDESTSPRSLTLGTGTLGYTGKDLQFIAEIDKTGNQWWNKVDKIIWQLDSDAPQTKSLTEKFFITKNLTIGEHTLRAKGYNTDAGYETSEDEVKIIVKEEVISIKAETGWDPTTDIDLSVYFTYKNGTKEKIDYKDKSLPYATFSGDDTKGTKASTGNADETITINLNTLKSGTYANINQMEVYIHCYSSGMDFSKVKNLFARVTFNYSGGGSDKVEHLDIDDNSSINSAPTARIALIKRSSNGSWVLEDSKLTNKSLPYK